MAAQIFDGQPTGLHAAGWREVWRISLTGDAYRLWEKVMPRIRDEILDCAIYLYSSEQEALAGENVGASGFLVGVPFWGNPHRWHCYAVTNSHVIDGGCTVVRLNSKDGGLKTIPIDHWVHHPNGDDLAIALLDDLDTAQFHFVGVGPTYMISKENLQQTGLGAGDEIFMVGRFIDRDETQSNIPLMRSGHLEANNPELIDQGEERGHYKQESFLAEVHSISGFSGSPVFIYVAWLRESPERIAKMSDGQRRTMNAFRDFPARELLLGIDWGHLRTADGSPSGMAGIVPAWKLMELLVLDEVAEMRKEKESATTTTKLRPKLDIRGKSTQRTRARAEIPIPSKSDFMRDLDRATRRKKPSE